MSSGMDYWLGSWVDSGNGMEVRNWTGARVELVCGDVQPDPDPGGPDQGLKLGHPDQSSLSYWD